MYIWVHIDGTCFQERRIISKDIPTALGKSTPRTYWYFEGNWEEFNWSALTIISRVWEKAGRWKMSSS